MNKDVLKLFKEMVSTSLNSDQANVIANEMDRRFSMKVESGFGDMIAIPGTAAAETLVHFFKTEEKLVEFFERMLEYEGKFLYDQTCRLNYKDDFFKVLANNKWIHDPDTHRFFRDPFHAEQLNFLKDIELIDLRVPRDMGEIKAKIQQESTRLKIEDLTFRVTVRTFKITGDGADLLRDLIALLLAKQNLGALSLEIYTCLNELAINASKATYKVVFQKQLGTENEQQSERGYAEFMQAFRTELETNGDTNVAQMAEAQDKYFDIYFKSSPQSIACWATNYTVISRAEKLRFMKKLNYNLFGENLSDLQEDPDREGAGLGINLVMTILKRLSPQPQPLNVVFYPDRTKVGFVVKRVDMEKYLQTRT